MYSSRPSAAPSTSSTSTTATMSSMSSGPPSSLDSRSAFSLHRRTSLSQGHQRSHTDSTSHHIPGSGSVSGVYPTAYSPVGEPDDAPFLGTPFALERPYEYPFPSPETEGYPNLSKAWTNAAVASGLGYSNSNGNASANGNGNGNANIPSAVLAHSLLSSKKFSVEGGLAVAYVGTPHGNIPLKKRQQARENLAKRRATAGTVLHPLNIPQAHQPPIPPALLSREHAGQLSPILSQLSPRMGMGMPMPSPRMFRHWRGDENGNRNDASKRTTK
jgi:hypothetical protein